MAGNFLIMFQKGGKKNWIHKITHFRNLTTRVRPRFFYQVGHETMYASSGNKHFHLILSLQTYQNYEQSLPKLGTFLVNKVL